MIPQGWQKVSLHTIAYIQTGIAKGGKSPRNPVELPYLRVANVQDGHLDLSEIKTLQIDITEVSRYLLQKGDVLLTEGGDFDKLGRGAVWQGEIKRCIHQNHVFAVRLNSDQILPDFFAAQVASSYGKRYFLSCAKRSTNLASVNKTQLSEYPVLLPPLAEQRKIAAILGVWDEAIAATEKLIAALRARKKALMQRLLIPNKETGQPEIRSPGSTIPWETKRLDQVFGRVNRKNGIGNTNVLTASGQQGLVSQRDYFNRSVAGEAIENYYLIERGEFAYNRSSSDGYPFGAIKQLTNYDAGILSTLYLCFGLTDNNASGGFYRHFFEAGGLNQGIYSIAQEGARNHGLLNVSLGDFFGLPIVAPPTDDQQSLATFFDLVDYEIDLAVEHSNKIQQQKRGLMQRLLTGQVRVSVSME